MFHEILMKELCNFFSITREMLLSKRRTGEIVMLRMIYANILNDSPIKYTCSEIAAILNKKDHATILYYFEKHKDYVNTKDRKYLNYYESFNNYWTTALKVDVYTPILYKKWFAFFHFCNKDVEGNYILKEKDRSLLLDDLIKIPIKDGTKTSFKKSI